jgi:hypothetical protein
VCGEVGAELLANDDESGGRMGRKRAAGLGFLVAGLMLAPGASVAAAAGPEFGRCLKVAAGSGEFGNAGCTKTGGSKRYAWQSGVTLGFSTSMVGTARFEAGAEAIVCTAQSGNGELSGASGLSGVHLTVRGCTIEGFPCESLGDLEGEISTNTLEGALGVIKASPGAPAKDKIGLDLFPKDHAGLFFSEYRCGSILNAVSGSIIVPLKANKMRMTTTLKYAAKKSRQKPEAFEGAAQDVLFRAVAGNAPEQTGATLTLALTSEEPVEVRAGVE